MHPPQALVLVSRPVASLLASAALLLACSDGAPPANPEAGASPAAEVVPDDAAMPASNLDGSRPTDSDAGPVPPPPHDAGPAPDAGVSVGDWSPGDYPPALHDQAYLTIRGVKGQGDAVRGYKVHVPPSYRSDVPTPVVFAIHGLGQNPVMFAVDGAGWPQKSDAEGFILVMPTGNVQNADGTWGLLGSWNAGECCGGAATDGLDDVALIRAILAEVQTHLHVDARRVYATGFSNGGYMSFRLACEAADLFAAIAPASGAIGSPAIAPQGVGNADFKTCAPSAPVSVLAVHGTGDPLVPYAYMKPSLDAFARSNGCSPNTAPAQQPESGGDTSCVTYTGCPPGVEVTGCTVRDGGHCWFGSPNCGFGVDLGTLLGNNSDTLRDTDAAWSFLKRFARP